jgi:uncharacterized protein involved in exopolysaccharide biosynthesis
MKMQRDSSLVQSLRKQLRIASVKIEEDKKDRDRLTKRISELEESVADLSKRLERSAR